MKLRDHLARVEVSQIKPTVLPNVREVFERNGYSRSQVLPLRQKPFSVSLMGHEFGNLLRFCLRGRNLFGVSLLPSIYTKTFKIWRAREHLLYQLFLLNRRVPCELVGKHLVENDIMMLLQSGLLCEDEGRSYYAPVRVVPYRQQLYITDPWGRSIEDMCYLSYDSLFLADFIGNICKKRNYRRALDIGTGVGILASCLSSHCQSVIGTDINPRAIQYAKANATLNNLTNIDFAVMDMFSGLEGKFDLIVANPPFAFLPPEMSTTMRDSYGGHLGLEVTVGVLEGLKNHLSDKGQAIILSKAPIVTGNDLLWDRVLQILGHGGWKVYYNEVSSSLALNHIEFYRLYNISRFVMTVLVIERSDNGANSTARNKRFLGSIRYQF